MHTSELPAHAPSHVPAVSHIVHQPNFLDMTKCAFTTPGQAVPCYLRDSSEAMSTDKLKTSMLDQLQLAAGSGFRDRIARLHYWCLADNSGSGLSESWALWRTAHSLSSADDDRRTKLSRGIYHTRRIVRHPFPSKHRERRVSDP